MKKFQLLNWILVSFIIFQFSSCENEPLEGDFVTDICSSTASDGYLVAKVNSFNFRHELPAEGVYGNDGASVIIHENGFTHLNISALVGESEQVMLEIINPSLGTHILSTVNETGLVGNQNNHEFLESFGYYQPVFGSTTEYPYVTYSPRDGVGVVDITLFDEENQLVSGTFSFNANRAKRDPISGEIENDSSGNPIIEIIEISCGSFNNVPFVYGLSGPGTGNPQNEFFAKVDGEDFIASDVSTSRTDVSDISMVKIVAVNEEGQEIRIDLPEELGTGTFAMEELSDGTKVIGLYNPNVGGEHLTSNPGTITITKFNTNTGVIEATFEFTATDPIGVDPTVAEITEGSFSIDYILSSGDLLNTITADVDGDFFDPDTIVIEETFYNGVTRISAIAIDTPNNRKLGIFFPKNIEVGTYEMEAILDLGDEKFSQFTPDIGVSITYTSIPGTLTITEYDPDTGIIEGTFSYTAVDILNQDPTIFEITNGDFVLDLD